MESDRDDRVSLHPLDPRQALKALLRTKPDKDAPANGEPKPKPNGKRRTKKPARSEARPDGG